MKLKTLFTSMIATLALAGCSSEDGPNMGNDTNDDGYGYVAVNIVEPKSVGSKANGSDQFQDGTPEENKAETGLFFIYNQEGTKMYNDPQVINLANGDTPGDNSPYVEKIYKAVLVIDGVAEEPTVPLQIICVLNAPAELAQLPKATPLSVLKDQIDNYGAHTSGAFIMSNSVYKDGTTDVCGAIVTEDNLKNSASAALAAPVNIYVERVVARIQAKSLNFKNDGAKPTVDGQEKAFTIKVTGIEVANIAQNSYLLKNINNISHTWNWNDPTNKRSYWETVPATDAAKPLTFGNKSYTQIATDANFDIATLTGFKEYVQPNTTSNQKTAILVTAQLMDGDAPADLAYIRGGYTTKEKAKDIVATYLQSQGYYKAGTAGVAYTSITPADLDWKNNGDFVDDNDKVTWLERYEVVAQIASTFNGTLYKKSTEGTYTEISADVINEDLKEAENYVARVFTNGLCYYYVNIDQTPVATDNGYVYTGEGEAKGVFEGVIRNHIYDLTLNSISGVGTPIFDPEDVIIPETPGDETLWYLGAKVNVLKWRLVGQTVDFTGK